MRCQVSGFALASLQLGWVGSETGSACPPWHKRPHPASVRANRSERHAQPVAHCGGGGGAGGDWRVGPAWSGAATIPCVSQRWRRIWNSSTLLHPTLALDLHRLESQLCGPDDEASLLRLLEQRCAAARRVFLHREGQRLRMAAVLRLVSPQLQAVSDVMTVVLAAGLPQPRWCGLLLRAAAYPSPTLTDTLKPGPGKRRSLMTASKACTPYHSKRCAPQVYLGAGAPQDALQQLQRFHALRSLDLPAAACPEGQLPAFVQSLEELTLREGVSPALLRWGAGCDVQMWWWTTGCAPAPPSQTCGHLTTACPTSRTHASNIVPPSHPCLCSALASLPRLRLLSLTLTEALPAGHQRQLAGLRSLEELHLYFSPSQPTAFQFQPSGLTTLTRLRSVLLVAPRDSMCQPLTIGPGMSKLAALQELQVCFVNRSPLRKLACNSVEAPLCINLPHRHQPMKHR